MYVLKSTKGYSYFIALKMSRRKCHFTKELENSFPMFKRTKTDHEVTCTTCNQTINIANKGKHDLNQHLQSLKHKRSIPGSNSGSRELMENTFIKQSSRDEELLSACEATLCYHLVKHHFSYRSADCTHKLNATLFRDSKFATKVQLGRTKTEAVVNGVLSPYCINNIMKAVQSNETYFVGVSTDGSNHGSIKIFPILIQYFNKSCGICHKLIELQSVKNERAETISQIVLDCLAKYKILEKCIAFGADNCNTNFGSVQRRNESTGKNVFAILKTTLPSGKTLNGIGCPAHILNNCIQHALDCWPVDIESILLKVYNYFSVYTVRTEALKEFCDFVDVDYQQILRYTKTRWLSLFPVIERVLKLYEALKSYFDSISKPPLVLVNFFNDPLNEAYLYFVHSLSNIFYLNIKKMEKEKNSLLEIMAILQIVKDSLQNRLDNKFVPFITQNILNKFAYKYSENEQIEFKNKLMKIYSNAITYLDHWSAQFVDFNIFSWMDLKTVPEWSAVKFLLERNVNVNDTTCIDQLEALKVFLKTNNSSQDFLEKLSHEKWVESFKCTNVEQHSEFLKMAQYLFSIPSHNANIERIFSIINTQWTDERNRLSVDSIKHILFLSYNFKDLICTEFFELITQEKDILKKVREVAKYKI